MKSRIALFLDIINEIPMESRARRELALKAEVSESTLYNWKFGATISPQINTLYKVATALDLDIVLRKKSSRKLKLVS